MAESSVAAVVLAAGESRRFGGRKQLARLDGVTLLEHVLLRANAAGLGPIVAVVPVWLTRPEGSATDLIWVRNPFPERGMSHSLRLGLAAVPDAADAAVILLGDQPTVSAETIRSLIAARGSASLIATRAEGVLAPPLLIERRRFRLVEQVAGDVGLRDVMREEGEDVVGIDVVAHPPDVDTPEDLARLSQSDAG